MDILFLGSFLEKSDAAQIWSDSKGHIVVSGDTFQQALLDGFTANGFSDISLVTLPAIGSFPARYKKPWYKGGPFEYNNQKCVRGSFLNLPVIKQCGIYRSAKKHLMKWAARNPGDKTIIVYALFASYLQAAVDVKKKYPNTKICCIVLDLPEYFDDKRSSLHDFLKAREQKKLDKVMPHIDSYVMLTEQMTEALKIGSRPYLLMEGIFSQKDIPCETIEKQQQKTILYTGILDRRFGIKELLDAFKAIPDPDYRLWICGNGTSRTMVEEAAAEDSRICYFGLVKRNEVLRMQQQATLLINPRKADEEYTKYSFPSKTMEYMASGTPTIMYPLPGMPMEYYSHLAIVPDNTTQTLKNTIVEWCGKPTGELMTFGQRAKRFILENKNAAIQTGRLYEFLEKQHNG